MTSIFFKVTSINNNSNKLVLLESFTFLWLSQLIQIRVILINIKSSMSIKVDYHKYKPSPINIENLKKSSTVFAK
jgi:hypothetical protein